MRVDFGRRGDTASDYDDFSAFPQTFDSGLVVLSEPVYLSIYGVLPPKVCWKSPRPRKATRQTGGRQSATVRRAS